MKFDDALKEISKEYSVRRLYEKSATIEFDDLFDDANYMFIGVKDFQDKVLLTDSGDYAELVDYDNYEKEITALGDLYHISINNRYIEKEYKDNNDIRTFIDFLNALKEYSNEVLKEKELERFLSLSSIEQLEIVKKYSLPNGIIMTLKLQNDLWPILRDDLLRILDKLVSEGYLSKKGKDYFFIF